MSFDKTAKELYEDSGVNIKKADQLVHWLSRAKSPHDKNSNIGGFAAEFPLEISSYKSPILVSSTDGVGTKLLLAIENNQLAGIGQDLVGMCINDLYTSGAKPLFFLDYFSTSHLDVKQFQTILTTMKESLAQCNCSLVGGETAEMPGLYQNSHFDLAGFVVGIVEKEDKLGLHRVNKKDVLFALPSSGFHSNGFSLIRRLLKKNKHIVSDGLISNLLKPTKIYNEIPLLLERLPKNTIHSIAHITGGGILNNLRRVVPSHCDIKINFESLQIPEWMRSFLSNFAENIFDFESVFNLGCGAIIVVESKQQDSFMSLNKDLGLGAYPIGSLV